MNRRRPFNRTERLNRVTQQVRQQQRRDKRSLRGAIVGRALELPTVTDVNEQLHARMRRPGLYSQGGHIALVYLFRDELRDHLGVTFYNSAQIQRVVDSLGVQSTQLAVITRGQLRHVRRHAEDGKYWLYAIAQTAQMAAPFDRGPLNMRREELALANGVFEEDMDTTGKPNLWLGALTVRPSRLDLTLSNLETILPTSMYAGPIDILTYERDC